MKKILGIAMITSFFLGLFAIISAIYGIKAGLLIFGSSLIAWVFLLTAIDMIGSEN